MFNAAWRTRPAALVAALLVGLLPAGVAAGQARIAVATNFSDVVNALKPRFEAATGHQLVVTAGSTGKLYAQIINGAPFDVLLAADQRRPAKLEDEGDAVAGSRFTYARGRLVLWSTDPALIGLDGRQALSGSFGRLAIANPDLAPYGAAARDVLESLELYDAVSERLVLGENIGQAYAMVATGNAELGFVALSYVRNPRHAGRAGSHWQPPDSLHRPILQDAVLLRRGRNNSAAQSFLTFLQSADAGTVIEAAGYGIR